ncbi:XRE family transcriptional regulator [Rhodococcus sp. NPDC060086]|uniref:XRE family transcriptional regulator n=1 Tax=Rhodococcus sp. NPDC060086 TaxID=3347055 RepID=UPI00365E98C4
MTERFLSRAEVAEIIGVKPTSLVTYNLPEPDVLIAKIRGWRPETIREWQSRRPGRGARTDLR